MASQKGKGKQQTSNVMIEQEEVLQAIVILESYSDKLKPLSTDRAECLLTLLGKPLIEYTLSFLFEQGVEEIHLFCTNHYQQIKKYLEDNNHNNNNRINLYRNVGCITLNESMRQVNLLFSTRGLSRSHFILITAPGIIGLNMDVKEQIVQHKERYKANKNAIMTVLYSKISDDLILDFNNRQNKTYLISNPDNIIFNYYNSNDKNDSYSISPNVLRNLNNLVVKGNIKTSSKLNLRTDLFDTQIYFCASYVLHLFEDNFHTQNMSEFIDTIISDTISSNVIYCAILERNFNNYLATINDLNSYYFQIMKLLQRASSFNLGSNLEYRIENLSDSVNVLLNKKMLKVGRNICFKRNVFIEKCVEIGDNCTLWNCYIGKKCKIGSNVNISNSIILDETIIGNNTNINGCLFGCRVNLGNNCKLSENILFGDNCIINENTEFNCCGVYHVPPTETSGFSDDEDNDNFDDIASKVDKLNINNYNYVRYKSNKNGNEDDDFVSGNETDSEYDKSSLKNKNKNKEIVSNEIYESLKKFYIWPIKKSKVLLSLNTSTESNNTGSYDIDDDNDDDEYFELDENYDDDSESETSEVRDVDSDNYDDDDDDDNEERNNSDDDYDTKNFTNAINTLLIRALTEKTYDIDNLLFEIAGCKAAHYAEINDVSSAIAKLLIEYPIINKEIILQFSNSSNTNITYMDLMKIIMNRYEKLFSTYFFRDEQSQIILYNAILEFFMKKQVEEKYFVSLLLALYNGFDKFDDMLMIKWYQEKLASSDGEKKRLLESLNKFITWLGEEEEDDDDDDDDDDDE